MPLSELGKLWRLQQLDLEQKKLQSQLDQPKHQAEHDQAHAAARVALRQLKQNEEALEQLQKQVRRGELELATIEAQIKDAESALYGGNVTNSRELAGIERKLANARQQKGSQEETLLNIMQKSESLQEETAKHKKVARKVTGEYKAIKASLDAETTDVKQKLEQVILQRQEAAANIKPEWLSRYDKMRQQRADAIAMVEGNICGACRVQLPGGLINQARTGQQLAYCESCGRLLYGVE